MSDTEFKVGALEINERSVVHEQETTVSVNLTREVKPRDIAQFGQHFLQADFEMGEPETEIKNVDVVQTPASDRLVQVKEGGGWAGIVMGHGVTFTVVDLYHDAGSEPLRVLQFEAFDELRALPVGRHEPEEDWFTAPDGL